MGDTPSSSEEHERRDSAPESRDIRWLMDFRIARIEKSFDDHEIRLRSLENGLNDVTNRLEAISSDLGEIKAASSASKTAAERNSIIAKSNQRNQLWALAIAVITIIGTILGQKIFH